MIVDHALEDSTSSIPSKFMWAVEVLGVLASLAKRIADRFNADTVHQSFGFVAQRVERHVEGVSVAVSKPAEATKLSARSLAWLEALALGAR